MIIRRAELETNGDGDPVGSEWEDHLTFSGKFAPSNPSENIEPGRNTVITGGAVYIRDLATRPDVSASDRAVIRGVEYEIDGEVGSWLRSSGWAIQFAVKKVQ